MPFSRSRSFESRTRSFTSWFARKAPDCQSSASTRVVFPWSTWAMIARLRKSSRADMKTPFGGSLQCRWGGGRPWIQGPPPPAGSRRAADHERVVRRMASTRADRYARGPDEMRIGREAELEERRAARREVEAVDAAVVVEAEHQPVLPRADRERVVPLEPHGRRVGNPAGGEDLPGEDAVVHGVVRDAHVPAGRAVPEPDAGVGGRAAVGPPRPRAVVAVRQTRRRRGGRGGCRGLRTGRAETREAGGHHADGGQPHH